MRKSILAKRVGVLLSACAAIMSLAFVQGANALTGRFNMSYIYFGDKSLYSAAVSKTQNSLSNISPNYFNINSDGTLNLTSAFDKGFINEMHTKGIKVVPFISNHWDRELGRSALANRALLAQQIADAVRNYNLDGVNVDIENVTEVDRSNYNDFVKLLREKLPAGSEVSVAVAANPYGLNVGWQGSYDYTELAKYSDYLMIMAYDEHYQSGPAGPVASYSFVENSIKYALQKAPKEKIVLGIPFYGRYWKNGQSYGGYGVSLTQVDEMIKKFNSQVTFDNTSKSPKAVVTITQDSEPFYVLGSRLSAGTYEVWFENEQSIKSKLDLVRKYDLKGTGCWSLGQELPSTWDYYSLWLNGCKYQDIMGHWAEKSIMDMVDKGWMIGVSDSTFAPDDTLTRAEAAVLMVRALGLRPKDIESSFLDTANHWAKREISIAMQNGVIQGKGDATFGPDEPITREQLAVMMDRILQQKIGSGSPKTFSDVTQAGNPWSYDAIMRLAANGVLTGTPEGKFEPFKNTTRAEMATLMDRIAGYLN